MIRTSSRPAEAVISWLALNEAQPLCPKTLDEELETVLEAERPELGLKKNLSSLSVKRPQLEAFSDT